MDIRFRDLVSMNKDQRKRVKAEIDAKYGSIKMSNEDWQKILEGAHHDDERVQMVQNGIRN